MSLKTNEARKGELSCTHRSLRRAARHLTQIYDDALAPSGLTSSQSLIVASIDELGGHPGGEGPTLKQLARSLGVQLSALSHAFGPLQRDGLVKLNIDVNDKRVKRAVLTEEGKVKMTKMYALWIDLTDRVENALGKGVNDQLSDLLEKVSAIDPVSLT